ncbi:5-oxoprolinase subunit B/C family protein [Arthrobacter sp. HLT1-20]
MAQKLHIRPVGQTAILVELDTLAEVMDLQAALREQDLAGLVDIVAAAQTVLISCESPATVQRLTRWLATATVEHRAVGAGTLHTLDTVYDGADLANVAQLVGLSADAVAGWHSGQDWLAAFGGFAPGFMYLTPSCRALAIPRHATPRTAVPAGSVAVGGKFSAVYPSTSPGGWQLLGRNNSTLWDSTAEVPALLQPGDRVRFRPVRELARLRAATLRTPPTPASQARQGFQVLGAGTLTTVQDLGRAGFAHLGVPASGALDRAALRRANRMVGNGNTSAAALETVLTGLRVKSVGSHVVAVTGAAVALDIKDTAGQHRLAPLDTPFMLFNGDILTLGGAPGSHGFRSYLAVRGGLDVPAVLGSRSTDLLSGLGPAAITAATFLPVAPANKGSIVALPELPPTPQRGITELRFRPGPRADWFTPASLLAFGQQTWTVTAQSNRIGLRLHGPPLERTAAAQPAELPSEGMVDGAIQVPPSGLPVLFLADHPVTGGYPVLGVVLREDLDMAAQLPPGAAVRFVPPAAGT